MLFFALLDIIYSYSLANPPPQARQNSGLLFIQSIAPLWAWSALWGVVGVVCLVNAFRISDRYGFAAAIGIKVLWGLVYVAGMFAGLDRAYVSATVWLCLAGWVAIISTWPEPPDLRAVSAPLPSTMPPPELGRE